MRKIRLICGLVFVAVLIVLALVLPKQHFYLSVQDDKVYYGMDVSELRDIKGIPNEISNSLPGEPVYYRYSETIENAPAEVSYKFMDAKLMGADYTINLKSKEDALSAFNKIKSKLTEAYSKKKPFSILELDDLSVDESFQIISSKCNCKITVKDAVATVSCSKSE